MDGVESAFLLLSFIYSKIAWPQLSEWSYAPSSSYLIEKPFDSGISPSVRNL
jgi:hypothetical protein